MNGTASLKPVSKSFPTDWALTWWEALLLLGAGAFAVVLHQSFRWPLGLPGHHGIEWMALLLLGRASSRFRGAGSLTSLGAAATALLPGWGFSDPFIWLIYLVPGPVMDVAFRYLPRYADKVWFFMLLGGLAHVTKPVIRLVIAVVSGWSFGSFRYGVAYPIASHFLYGLIGGLLGALLVLGLQRLTPKSPRE